MAGTVAEKPMYFLFGEVYNGNMPAYFNTADYAWIKTIEDNWQIIRDEILSDVMPQDFPIPNYNPNLVKEAKVWRNICFFNYRWAKHKNIRHYPKTNALLKQVPNLTYAAINMLEPQAEIYPHRGDTNTTVRFHLGITIPAGLPQCGIMVNGETKGWEEGKMIAFSDAHLHSVWNRTDEYRFIFVIDVMQPQYVSRINTICTGILSALTVKHLFYNFKLVQMMPKWIGRIMHYTAWAGWRVYLPLQRALKFLP